MADSAMAPIGWERALMAAEKVKERLRRATKALDNAGVPAGFQVVSLEALVVMKLNSNRLKDKVHLLDLIGVGQLDHTWPARVPPELAARLQQLLDNPNG